MDHARRIDSAQGESSQPTAQRIGDVYAADLSAMAATPAPVLPPKVSLCVSFCETTDPLADAAALEDLLAATCQEAGFPQVERVYAGSYFCENYFCGLPDRFHEALSELCERFDLGATLVVPLFGQALLERGDKRVNQLLERFSGLYDEVVANDVATFTELAQRGDIRVGLGRLFSKELRDRRYDEVFETLGIPGLSPEAACCLQMQRQSGRVPLVEVDPTSAVVNVESLRSQTVEAVGSEPEIAVHLPLCYATTGRVCSAASIGLPDEEKFAVGRGCALECLRVAQGSRVESGVRYLKHGRTYFFANPDCRIAGATDWRIVYAAATASGSSAPSPRAVNP